ncbi:beta-ketoacyl synthase N-terminal-like domain-containing protein [Streptomyces stelliscabiei]|uniref:beta-ketoacyl synthase N-terminal-like domain-containing protein n=1 Tax=Streptomyces stelliscabiei TaxID=146820 RepID=UPI0029B5B2A5|nr:beta-ketoacyl synthase N-terminal-like domain-containing protein [Streptomyces stelliscabiei]MDX2551530.1 beta-ketoacyl synthase N-terminal-like domain-containing protein [Streptomyces stelliscabiei]MDX2614372.1 beta-ketoacyl synthase N-terminal-like domain-containing protein [Streptomyces stelliscabiei]MDX2635913.1 beta-ketoacyl synthase N-terminal-like domain-containing protein [Streptomyces stelliscabiei]MDX2666545.1 beta-ketoacyl synthase N-terminal-like domain-containing protein [Strept
MTTAAAERPVISAWSALSPWGDGAAAFRTGLDAGNDGISTVDSEFWPGTPTRAGVVPGFRMDYPGTRGMRSLDRLTRLTLRLSGLLVTSQGGTLGAEPEDTGMVFATSGSFKTCLDFTSRSYSEKLPFHVDVARFPSTAANCAASRSAIGHGFKGPSTTLTGGAAGGLLALGHAARLLRQQRAQVLLAGAAEEYTEDRALLEHALHEGEGTPPPVAEGGALFLMESATGAADRGRTPLAVLLGLRFRAYHPRAGGDAGVALGRCVTDLLKDTGTSAGEIGLAVRSDPGGHLGDRENTALDEVFAGLHRPLRHLAPLHRLGNAGSAATAFQVAAALGADGVEPLRAPALITSVENGRVSAVLLGPPTTP